MSALSERLIEYKKSAGYRSVAALAKEVNIPVTTLYDVISERTVKLSVDNSQKLADFMGISVDELYGKEKAPDAEASEAEFQEAINLLKQLSETERQNAIDYLKFLSSKQ